MAYVRYVKKMNRNRNKTKKEACHETYESLVAILLLDFGMDWGNADNDGG